jgi:ribonuclease P/MRP protein subunit POP3
MPIAGCKIETSGTKNEQDDQKTLSMVIVTHPKPSISTAHAHLPTLVHLTTLEPSSSTQSEDKTTRLIPLATSTDARLASALHIPRVGALAIFANAPGAKALEDFVRAKVGVTECPWIDEAMSAEWKGTNVKTEYVAGKTKPKPKPTTNKNVNAGKESTSNPTKS